MFKTYFSKVTLFTILAFLSLVAFVIIAISHQPDEIKNTLLYRLAFAVILFAGIDILLKQILKLKNGWLWAAQIFILFIAVYLWIISD